MVRPLSYAEAVRLLGGGESRLVNALDWLAGVGMAASGLELLDVREEAVRYGHSMTRGLSERLKGVNRLTRTERLRAAHTVIVLTAYFDALVQEVPDLRLDKLSAREQILLGDGEREVNTRRDIARSLTAAEVPAPSPSETREALLTEIRSFYIRLGRNIVLFASGLAAWDDLDETRRQRIIRDINTAVPDRAIVEYEELYRQLAIDCPEFKVWTGGYEQRSARAELQEGMANLERLLMSMASDQENKGRRSALSRAYQAALDKPITLSGDVSSRLRIPSLREGYLEHRIKVATADGPMRPSQESWWKQLPVRDDTTGFLAAYLTSPQATSMPMLVLGQPGSGKSVLTRVLAARLPDSDFLPVRVELRQAPAEPDFQTRVEDAIRQTTGEQVSWPRLVESCQGALPVILLDGFDELLQATGVTQTDFLMRIAAFQEREADQGRPVAVMVTSRIAVADRAQIPQGSLVMRLEPFSEQQISSWLDRWEALNGDALRDRNLRPLPLQVALAHRELAEQPLLLLMLALYDADDNALQHRSADFKPTELYERLLKEFASRQIRKHTPELDEESHRHAVETELLRLSIVAFAMFNRNSQWVSETDLNEDLSVLLPARDNPLRDPTGLRAPLMAAQVVIGRFFFVHQTQVTRDSQPLQTYEFLHSTFGEFLIARLVVQILVDMAAREQSAGSSPLSTGVDDSLLHALLSFAGLTSRAPVVTFLADLFDGLDEDLSTTLTALLLRLHRFALHRRVGSQYDRYEPRPLTVPDRYAAWSLNLVTLAVLASGEVTGSQLFPGANDTVRAWRSHAAMWRSRLIGEAWAGFFLLFSLDREWNGDRIDIRLRQNADDPFPPATMDVFWAYKIRQPRANRASVISYLGHAPDPILRKTNLSCFVSDDVMAHALLPVFTAFPNEANMFVAITEDRAISAAHALLAAMLAKTLGEGDERPYEELAIVAAAIARDVTDSDMYLRAALDVLVTAVDEGAATKRCLALLQDYLPTVPSGDAKLSALIARTRALLSVTD